MYVVELCCVSLCIFGRCLEVCLSCTCMVSHRNSRIFLCVMQLAMQNATRLRKYFFFRENSASSGEIRTHESHECFICNSHSELYTMYLHVLVHGSELFSENRAVPGVSSSVALLCLSRVSVVSVCRDCTYMYVHHSWSRAASLFTYTCTCTCIYYMRTYVVISRSYMHVYVVTATLAEVCTTLYMCIHLWVICW